MIDAYPLSWPAGWPRTLGADRLRPKFHRTESVKSSFSDNYYRQKREITVARRTTVSPLPSTRKTGVRVSE